MPIFDDDLLAFTPLFSFLDITNSEPDATKQKHTVIQVTNVLMPHHLSCFGIHYDWGIKKHETSYNGHFEVITDSKTRDPCSHFGPGSKV